MFIPYIFRFYYSFVTPGESNVNVKTGMFGITAFENCVFSWIYYKTNVLLLNKFLATMLTWCF